jgi:ribonuclease HI
MSVFACPNLNHWRKRMDIYTDHLEIYTDGSCYPNDGTGSGGWAYSTFYEGQYFLLCNHIPKPTTNNIAELSAMIAAVMDNPDGEIYSDSEYVVKGFNLWMRSWQNKGWKKKKGDLKNVIFWKELAKHKQNFKGKVKWIRGHNGNFMNELADAGANYARLNDLKKPKSFEMGLEEARQFVKQWAGRDRYRA